MRVKIFSFKKKPAGQVTSKKAEITFISKPGCHLCDEAKPTVLQVISKLETAGFEIAFTEQNVLEDGKLFESYAEDIPVVLINDKRHSFWHVDADRLEKELRKKAK